MLEHVGAHSQRQQLADNVHDLADRYWVQTPYRYFPIEPHWVFQASNGFPTKRECRYRFDGIGAMFARIAAKRLNTL